jgi:hypothetical protein
VNRESNGKSNPDWRRTYRSKNKAHQKPLAAFHNKKKILSGGKRTRLRGKNRFLAAATKIVHAGDEKDMRKIESLPGDGDHSTLDTEKFTRETRALRSSANEETEPNSRNLM